MAQYRKSKAMKEQVKELAAQGFGTRKIACALKISRNTVKTILRSQEEVQAMNEPLWSRSVDWEVVEKEYRKGVTIKILHKENVPQVSYTRFRRYLRSRVIPAKEVTMRLEHKAGEKVFIDFADGIELVDRETGEVTKTEFFCGVLPFSGYIFGEFVLDQKLTTFLSVQERMFHFFGGVTPYVTPDNLKSAVTKAHLYDPDENMAYCEFGNHYGFAVLPARPRKPRDKGAVENAVGVIQRQFYNEVRHQTFYSLEDLNKAFKCYLYRLNNDFMKDYGISRSERFEEERKHLKPLPAHLYELSEWREAKVHPDCEIQVDKNFYTVPFVYVGKMVRVRLRAHLIEVFDKETARYITNHTRLKGRGSHSRYDWHYPPAKIQQTRFDVQSAKSNAHRIGANTGRLIDGLFEGSWPLRGLRRAQGILRLANKHTKNAMEYACDMALKFNKVRYEYIKKCAEYYDKNGSSSPAIITPRRDLTTTYLHCNHV